MQRQRLENTWQDQLKAKRHAQLFSFHLKEALENGDVGLYWAPAEVAADSPNKVDQDTEEAQSEPLSKLRELGSKATKEFIIIAAYFVPEEKDVMWLQTLEKKGVDVKILTNSLASTDVVAVHSGYNDYREELLKSGIEIYEKKPEGMAPAPQRLTGTEVPPTAGLHAKLYIIDGEQVMVGSANFDPAPRA